MTKKTGILLLMVTALLLSIKPIQNGLNSVFQREKIENLCIVEDSVDIHNEVLNYRLKSKSRAGQVQSALKKAGFYKGAIDGKPGFETTRAVTAFQKASGLKADGIVGPRTWEKLKEYMTD